MKAKTLLLFDGVCNLCNHSVRFIYRRDKQDQFRYISLQSEQAEKILSDYNYEAQELNSVVVIHEQKLYTKSSAVLKVLGVLGFPYNLLTAFWLVPKLIRDFAYTGVANNRYRLFGKQNEVCEYDPEFTKKTQWNP